jgi:hypothetical protein
MPTFERLAGFLRDNSQLSAAPKAAFLRAVILLWRISGPAPASGRAFG